MGIEPTLSAWKAEVLPLNYTRPSSFVYRQPPIQPKVPNPPYSCMVPASHMVEGGGFEPPKAEPSDLQSDPVDRLGTPPKSAGHSRSIWGYCQYGKKLKTGLFVGYFGFNHRGVRLCHLWRL